jgi:hypothetical protein
VRVKVRFDLDRFAQVVAEGLAASADCVVEAA